MTTINSFTTGFMTCFTLTAALSACTPSYSIRQHADDLNAPISENCIADALHAVPEVSGRKVEFAQTYFDCKEGLQSQNYQYTYQDRTVDVRACTQENTLKSFRQSFAKMGFSGLEASKKAREVQAVMNKVESAVAKSCGLSDMTLLSKKECQGIKCEN